MTKYICECLDGARKCTHETHGFSAPTLCCVRSNSSCNWRRVEDQKAEPAAPKLPEWCKIGAWVWFSGAKDIGYEPAYLKITAIGYNGWENVIDADGEGITNMRLSIVKPARLRPWNDDELKSKVGKVFEMEHGDLTLCLGYQRDRGALYFAGKGPSAYSAKTLAESNWKLNGSPCGILEHKNEQGE